MNKSIQNLSIKHKLLLLIISSSFAAVVITGFFLLILEMTEFRTNMREDLSALANMIGNRSTAALMFDTRGREPAVAAFPNSLPIASRSFYLETAIHF